MAAVRTLRSIVPRLSCSWRWLPALLAAVALILPSLGSAWLLPAAHAGSTAATAAHAMPAAADHGAGHHAAPAVDTANADDTADALPAADDLPAPCADGLCGLCVALATRPLPALTEPAPPAWPAPQPARPAGRLVPPDTPPPIA